MEISSEKPRLFDEFLEISKIFSSFLSFATLKPVFIAGMNGIIKQTRRRYEKIEIILCYRKDISNNDNSSRDYGLIPLRFIKDNVSQVVSKWFELIQLYNPVYDLYLSSVINPSTVIENEFRNLVEGLEAYHRRRYPGKYMSNDEYIKRILPQLIDSIPNEVDDDFKNKLKNSFTYLNEFSLRKRINELITCLPKELDLKIQNNSGYKEDILRNIVLLRNYFSHFDPTEKRYIQKDPNILRLLNEEMRIILEANILRDLGFDPDYIFKFVRITKSYHH